MVDTDESTELWRPPPPQGTTFYSNVWTPMAQVIDSSCPYLFDVPASYNDDCSPSRGQLKGGLESDAGVAASDDNSFAVNPSIADNNFSFFDDKFQEAKNDTKSCRNKPHKDRHF